jgi:hypothetical protein
MKTKDLPCHVGMTAKKSTRFSKTKATTTPCYVEVQSWWPSARSPHKATLRRWDLQVQKEPAKDSSCVTDVEHQNCDQ